MTQEEINKKREAAGLQPMSNQNRVGLYDNIKQQAEEKQGNIFTRYGSRLFDNVKSQFSKAKESVTRGAELIEEGETTKGLIRGSLGPAAAASQAIFSPLTEAITPALTKGFEKTSEGIDKVSDNSVIQRIATSPVISKSLDAIFGVTGKAMKWVKDNPDDATILMDAIEVAGSAYGVKKVKPKLQAVKEAAIETADSTRKAATQVLKGVGEIADEAIDTLPKTAKELAQKVTSKLEAPKPTASQAVKQVLQGQTDDFASGVKAISNLDTVGIKTSKELVTRIDETISSLAQKVDTDLATDTTKKMLQDRMVASAAGNIVEKNPIIKALNQLDVLFLETII